MRDGELYLVNFNHLLHFSCYISTCPCPLQIVATAYAVHIKQLAAKVKPRMDFGLQCTYIYFLCTYAACTHLCKFGSSWLFTETAVCFIERVRLLQSSSVNSLPFLSGDTPDLCISSRRSLLFKSPLSISFNERLSVVVMLLSFMYPLSSSSLKAGKNQLSPRPFDLYRGLLT